MNVSIAELRKDTEKYVDMAREQDVYVTRNGKRVAKITAVTMNERSSAKALIGLLPSDVDEDAARMQRLK